MAENLSQAIRYGAQFAPRISMPEQQDFIGQAAEAASKAVAGIQQRKKAKEQQYKETRAQIESMDKFGMYPGHFEMLQEAANKLKLPEIIDEYSSSPEKQIQYENMIDELNQSIDYYENYYTTTFGKSGDPANGITFNSQLSRMGMNENVWGESGMEQVTSEEEMQTRLSEIQRGFHKSGSVRFEDGRIVYDSLSGGPHGQSIVNQNLPNQPFKPELRAIEMSGAEYFAKIDNGSFDTKDRMAAVMTNDLNRNSAAFQGIARHYIDEQKKKNQSYDETIEELMTNASKRQDVINFAIEEADEVRRKPKTTTRTMTNSQRKDIQNRQVAIDALIGGSFVLNQTISTSESSELSQTLNLAVDALDLEPITIGEERVKVTNIKFESDGSLTVKGIDSEDLATEPMNIKPSDPAYGALNSLLIASDANVSFDDVLTPEFLSRVRTAQAEQNSVLSPGAWASFGTQE